MALARTSSDTSVTANDIVTNAQFGTATVQLWHYAISAPANDKYIFGCEGWVNIFHGSTGVIYAFSDGNGATPATSGSAPLNTWNYIEFNWLGTTNSRLFLNGTMTLGTPVSVPDVDSTARPTGYGNSYDSSGAMTGSLGPLMLSNIQRHTSGYTAPAKSCFVADANSLVIWNVSEMAGTTVADATGNNKTLNLSSGTQWVNGGFCEVVGGFMDLTSKMW